MATTSVTAPKGSLTMNVGGQQWIATPNNPTAAQTAAAQQAGWTSYSGSYTPAGPSVAGGQPLYSMPKPTDVKVEAGILPTTAYGLPSPATPATPVSDLPSVNAQLGATGVTPTTTTTPATVETPTDKYLKSLKEAPSAADAYNQAQQEAGLRQAQEQKVNLQNALNVETNRMNLDLQNLRGVGAREGVTEAVYGQQSAQITREAMMRILPLQAQLALASDNLQMAQQRTDTLFKIYAEDAQNKVDFWNAQMKVIYDDATAKEKRQLDEISKQKDYDLGIRKDFISSINDAAVNALKEGNGALYSALTSTPPPTSDSTSKEWNNWVSDINKSVSKYGGGTVGSATTEMQQARSQESINAVTGLLSDTNIRSAVGPTWLGRFVGRGLDTATGGRQNFIASVEQLRSNLNLESLIQAKSRGATFGALSDQELRVLSSAATKIGSWAIKDDEGNVTGYRASEKDFKAELDKINNFAKLDYILKGGEPMDVGAQMMPDGSIVTANSDGTFTRLK